MGIEVDVDFLAGLQESWPLSGEIISLGDDHLRLLKHVLLYTFPGFVRPIDSRLIPVSTLLDAEDTRSVFSVLTQMEADVSYLQGVFLEDGTTDVMLRSNNLSDLTEVEDARANLGVAGATEVLFRTGNLSELENAAEARTNLNVPSVPEVLLKTGNLIGLTDLAVARTNLGVSATGDVLLRAGNLSELADAAAARANLGVAAAADTLLKTGNLSGLSDVVAARANLSVWSTAETASAIAAAVAGISGISDTGLDGIPYLRLDNTWVDATSTISAVVTDEITAHSADVDPHGDRAYTDTQLGAKQNLLVSGTNIKTINGGSLLGAGDLVIGLAHFTEGRSTAAPNATVPVHGLSVSGAETNIDLRLTPKGTGALLAQTPDGTAAGGNKRGDNAVDWQMVRTDAARVASGPKSVIAGGEDNGADWGCTVGGGVGNISNGNFGTIPGGGNNTTGAGKSYHVVGGGYANQSNGDYSTVPGGRQQVASGDYSTAGGGRQNTASGQYSTVPGGYLNSNSGTAGTIGGGRENVIGAGSYSFIPGGYQASARTLYGAEAHAAGRFSATGDAQNLRMVLRQQTTDATVTTLSAVPGVINASTTPGIPAGAIATAIIKVSAVNNSGLDGASWVIAVSARNDGATAALIGTPTVLHTQATAGAATWAVAATIDASDKAIYINVTGEAGKTIRWVGSIDWNEVL